MTERWGTGSPGAGGAGVGARRLAREVDAARETAGDVGPMDESELWRVVSRAARKGSVPAMTLLWEMLRAGGG